MSYLPSHQNSANERSERRQNAKEEIARTAKKVLLSKEAARTKFDKMGAAFLAAEKVSYAENTYRVAVGAGKKFYPVYVIGGKFECECSERADYGFCAHETAAELFAAKAEIETQANRLENEKSFKAALRYGNRKGLDFDKSARFHTKREACEWLTREAFNKFQPEGEVTDLFGDTVFELTEDFFELWEAA